VLNFYRSTHSTVKHVLENTQNDCHQWHSRLRPGLHWGSLQRSPRPRSWFKRALLLREGGEGKKRSREGRGEWKERKGGRKVETPPPSIPAYASDSIVEYSIEYLIEYSNTRPIPEVAINYRLSGPKQ